MFMAGWLGCVAASTSKAREAEGKKREQTRELALITSYTADHLLLVEKMC